MRSNKAVAKTYIIAYHYMPLKDRKYDYEESTMKKTMRILFLMLIICSIVSVSVFAQTGVQVNSVSDLDREINALGTRIASQIKIMGAGTRPAVSVGNFTFQQGRTNLGSLLSQNLVSILSIQALNQFLVIPGRETAPQTAASSPNVNYIVSGEIVDAGTTLRVYTRLTSTANNAIMYSWQIDFQKTPFLMNMLNVSGSNGSSVMIDLMEFDSIDNPVVFNIHDAAIMRTIHSGTDEDWFSYTASEDAMILFLVDGDFDSRMAIFDSNKRQVAENDDYRGNNAGILYSIRSGDTIYIKVFGYSSSSTGSYSLTAELMRIEDADYEPNDSMDEATLVQPGDVINGFFTNDDSDWYEIFVPSGGRRLRVYTEGDTDTCISLYDENGNHIRDDDDSGEVRNAMVTHQPSSAGTYYVEVTQYSGGSGTYTFFVVLEEAPLPDAYEPDDTMADASEIVIDRPQVHTFSDGYDEDWTWFTVRRSAEYVITAIGENSSLDTYIELYDADGEYLDENDDGGNNLDARLRIHLEPGTYYILTAAYGDFDDSESYTLTITTSGGR